MELLFSLPAGGSLGYLLLQYRDGNKLALRGMHIAPEHRRKGLSRLFLACWLMICFKLNLSPATNKMDKPLISLALQELEFVAVNANTPIKIGRQPTAAGETVCWDPKGNLHNLLPHTHLKKQMLVIASEEPTEHRTVHIRTEFVPRDLASLRQATEALMSDKFTCFSVRMLATASLFLHKDRSNNATSAAVSKKQQAARPATVRPAAAAGELSGPSPKKRKFAQKENLCGLCGLGIGVGQEIWPVPGTLAVKLGKRFAWGHIECARRELAQDGMPLIAPASPYWSKRGRCQYGDDCFYTHAVICGVCEVPAGGASVQSLLTRKKRPNRANKGHTVSVFRRWLLEHFGQLKLRSGSGVLDFAGGKGELAFELENLNFVNVTLIDPRATLLAEYTGKLQRGLYASNPIFHKYLCDEYWKLDPAEPRAPHSLKILFTGKTIEWLADEGTAVNSEYFASALEEPMKSVLIGESSRMQNYTKLADGTLVLQKENDSEKQEAVADDSVNVRDAGQAANLLLNSSVVLGLHPDGAAEPLIDFALRFNKPFALVPCCTCSKQFPNRKLVMPDGSVKHPVKAYEDLVTYLKQKDPRIQSAELDFDGKNTILYMLPDQLV